MELISVSYDSIGNFLNDIHAIEQSSFRTPWSIQSFVEQIELPFSHIWCLKDQKRVVAYCCFWMVLDELHLLKFATHPSCRRKGLGSKLMEEICNFSTNHGISRIDLEVRASNSVAISFYKKHSFEKVGVRKNYYTNPKEDALLMSRFGRTQESLIFLKSNRQKEVKVWGQR